MVAAYIIVENEAKYRDKANHNHLTQPPDYENIKRGFRNIQEIQQYQFTWFLLCVGKIADGNRL